MTEHLDPIAARVGESLLRLGLVLATAESCTGGWIAKTLTDIPGSSAWLDRGFVTYSNESKVEMLGVDPGTLESQGAVSEAAALEMAVGALAHSRAQAAVVATGIAGPDGGSAEKPVGTVWLAWAIAGRAPEARKLQFAGNREEVRHQSVRVALEGLLERLG
jgi:nicotinamide-nucleotide amidase